MNTVPMQPNLSRRGILKGGAAALALGPFFPGRVLGANDRMNVAVIGIRSQGTAHIGGFARIPNVRVKTLCDIDQNLFGARLAEWQKENGALGYTPGTATDMRRVFDDKDIDAVSFATPNHWHALGTIWACQAKKNVYVEKPACHTVFEGKQMVNAARRYGVLVQVGFQNRSRRNTRAAMKLLHDGKLLGKIFMARGLCFKPRTSIGRHPDGPMADGSTFTLAQGANPGPGYTKAYLEKVDYDQWMGSAPRKPFNPNRFHYNWHWQWDYGGGDTANQGPHQFDVGRWGLGREDYPVRVRSYGGLYLYGDSQQETPNTQTTVLEYADGTVFEFATRGLLTNVEGGGRMGKAADGKHASGLRVGNIFYGSEGRLEIDGDGSWRTYLGRKDEAGPTSETIQMEEKSNAMNTVGSGLGGHFGNFVDAVRAGNQAKLTCDVDVGVRSSFLPIMANISYRLKRELKLDGKREQFLGDAEANRMLKRTDRKGYVVPNLGSGSKA